MTDEEIVSRIVDNNETHFFEIIYDRFSSHIYNKCYSFVNNEDDAKDLTQDIFLKLYLKMSTFKGKSKFSTWVYSFTYNHCVNYVNRTAKLKYEKRLADNFYIENYTEDHIETNALEEKSGKKLTTALQNISADDRSILGLKYQEDLSLKSIQSVLGIGESAVKMRIKRAKERLANSYALTA